MVADVVILRDITVEKSIRFEDLGLRAFARGGRM